MQIIFKKVILALCLALALGNQSVFSEQTTVKAMKGLDDKSENANKTAPERIASLIKFIDRQNSSKYVDKENNSYLDRLKELVALSRSYSVENIEAYKYLLQGYEFAEKKEYIKAQNSFKRTISLFDKEHKDISSLLSEIRGLYNFANNQEERLEFYNKQLNYYLINGPSENIAPCYHAIAGYYNYKADFNQAISNYLRAASNYKSYNPDHYRNGISVVGSAYVEWGNYKKGLEYINEGIKLSKAANDSTRLIYSYLTLSYLYNKDNNYNKSIEYARKSIDFNKNSFYPQSIAVAKLYNAYSYIKLNRLQEATPLINEANLLADSLQIKIYSIEGAFELDYTFYEYYKALKQFPKATESLIKAYNNAKEVKSNVLQLKYLKELSLFLTQQKNYPLAMDFANAYYELSEKQEEDQSKFKVAQFENEEKELQQTERINALRQTSAVQAATLKKNNIILWGSIIALIMISALLFFVYRQFLINRKTLLTLRKTQTQLVQAEKMASLGELTAGIAHEIQNPLNFVNNFSEVSSELLEEMALELDKGDISEALALASDVRLNLEKINHHGKRADSIVKSMLQHSRSNGGGQKELTDLNALVDEYLRLSYHGLRAKDKSFNAAMHTDLDPAVGKVEMMPQDMGRVLLNLFNNAFYSVQQKKAQGPDGFEPTLSVSTRRTQEGVEVKVRDNGTGIPQAVLDKIYQPFYTTKPTGEGTGLGLSMSYDIITKGHGGTMKTNTREGQFAEFDILLPA